MKKRGKGKDRLGSSGLYLGSKTFPSNTYSQGQQEGRLVLSDGMKGGLGHTCSESTGRTQASMSVVKHFFWEDERKARNPVCAQ